MSKKTTTDVTYKFDEHTGKMIGKTIVETVGDAIPSISDDEYKAEIGTVLEPMVSFPLDNVKLPLLQTLITAMAGGALGILLYRAFQ